MDADANANAVPSPFRRSARIAGGGPHGGGDSLGQATAAAPGGPQAPPAPVDGGEGVPMPPPAPPNGNSMQPANGNVSVASTRMSHHSSRNSSVSRSSVSSRCSVAASEIRVKLEMRRLAREATELQFQLEEHEREAKAAKIRYETAKKHEEMETMQLELELERIECDDFATGEGSELTQASSDGSDVTKYMLNTDENAKTLMTKFLEDSVANLPPVPVDSPEATDTTTGAATTNAQGTQGITTASGVPGLPRDGANMVVPKFLSTHTIPDGKTATDVGNLRYYSPLEVGELVQHVFSPLANLISNNKSTVNTDIQQQMLSRQAVSKDLPNFDGDIDHWSLFISQYRTSTEMCGLTNAENMLRLQKCLKGKARELVQPILGIPDNVEEIINSLEMTYGRPDLIIKNCISKAKNVLIPKETKGDSLIQFSNVVRNMIATFDKLNCDNYVNNPQLLDELVLKLPSSLQLQWCTVAFSKQNKVNIRDLCEWLRVVAGSAALMPSTGIPVINDRDRQFPRRNFQNRHQLLNANVNKKPTFVKKCIVCDCKGHFVHDCAKFKKLDVASRWNLVAEKKLCFICLKYGHQNVNCFSKKRCGISGCTQFHHELLHRPDLKPTKVADPLLPTKETLGHVSANSTQSRHVQLRVVPVKLSGPSGVISTYALLDDGATVTIIDSQLASQLGLEGPVEPLCFSWTNNSTQHEKDSMNVKLGISGAAQGVKSYTLNNVRTVNNLHLPAQYMDVDKLKREYSYLQDLPVTSLCGATPLILIGQDNSFLTLPRKYKCVSWDTPIATKTLLGWVIHGNSPLGGRVNTSCAFHLSHALTYDDAIHEMVKRYFTTESFGVRVLHDVPRSKEDSRGFALLASTTKRVGERFETGLLWKYDDIFYPESKITAVQRLHYLEKKLDEDPVLAKAYCDKMDDALAKGYSRRVSDEDIAKMDLNPKHRFLCHFAITNPNKPGKTRVVQDAKAKSCGVSFNDNLITGPDLLRPLPAVLWNFRKCAIAFTADIKEMFPQVLIKDEDVVSQRFLWRGMRRDIEPEIFEMKAMIFGAACSPTSAIYVKNLNAEEFKDEFPEVFRATTFNFYMDDFLYSKDTVGEAIQMILDMIKVHKRGGFNLCNWTCSSKEVLKQLPEDMRANNFKDLNLEGELPVERVLGMFWDSEADEFTYRLNFHKVSAEIKDGSKRPTKRDVLKLVMSVFDPLGILSFFVVRARILLQDIWASGIDWDTEISDLLYIRWKLWIDDLQKITAIRIPRCYHNYFSRSSYIELHVFVDASAKAFATVAYFRFQIESGFALAIIAGRVRVAPVKPMSIPRLELQAAVMGSRLAQTIKKEHDVNIQRTIFWSDSKTVVSWIRSDSKRFKMFVGHRIGEIQEISDSKDWRWIPTKLNVSDDATRDSGPCDVSSSSRWIQGPSFLLDPEADWPTEPSHLVAEDKSELKSDFVAVIIPSKSSYLPDIHRFSSWLKLIRSTAWLLRFIKKFISKWSTKKPSPVFSIELSPEELRQAELAWIKKVQDDCFSDDKILLLRNQSLPKSSKLHNLSAILDSDGFLRIDGRLQNANVELDTKFPFILDSHIKYSRLLIEHFHQKLGHQGQETILNELRQRYWIISARCTVKKVCRLCLQCQKRKCVPVDQLMGQLPISRVTEQGRYFDQVGMDYFGPILVLSEGKRVKKYGVIFTCFKIRAIHLEIADSLTSGSAIMAIRRFVSRRGSPTDVFSDNGTNLRKAERLLRAEISKFDQLLIQQTLSKEGITWHFSPPGAPHFGGSWERLIRSVKTALSATVLEKIPNFEILRTLMIEAEHIINSRPLTTVSVDPKDPLSLTPNHFLISRSSPILSPGVFDSKDLNLRFEWRMAQRLIDSFWKRWVREYLPQLLRRTKWLQKLGNIKIGDVAILVDPAGPRNTWPLGRISAVYPGKDSIIRVVDITTTSGTYRRSLSKICLLQLDSNDDEFK